MLPIGQRIRKLREQRGLSQGDIERSTGLLRPYISRVEHGRSSPSLETLERLAAVFEIPLHDFFREPPKQEPAAGGDKERFLSHLLFYLRQVSAADRERVMDLAERLAGEKVARKKRSKAT
jgi:transcriptional regulator with XRE-family HTH domain